MPLLSASIVSAPVATSETYVDIPGLYIDIAKAEIRDGKLQVILNVPTPYATGNNFPGIYFAIATDKGVVADGCFTYSSKVPEATGRMPFTLVATIDVGTGVTFVKGQWKSVRGSAMHIDSYASLSAIGGAAAQSSSQGSGSGSGETGAGGNPGGTGSGTIDGLPFAVTTTRTFPLPEFTICVFRFASCVPAPWNVAAGFGLSSTKTSIVCCADELTSAVTPNAMFGGRLKTPSRSPPPDVVVPGCVGCGCGVAFEK